jgi:hypothetical protein
MKQIPLKVLNRRLRGIIDKILSHDRETIDEFWNHSRVYYTLIHIQLVTTNNSSPIADSRTLQSITTHFRLISLLYLHQSSGNGFQRRMFSFLWVSELFPCFSCSNYRLTDCQTVTVTATLQLAVCRQSVRLCAKPLEDCEHCSFFNNTCSYICVRICWLKRYVATTVVYLILYQL